MTHVDAGSRRQPSKKAREIEPSQIRRQASHAEPHDVACDKLLEGEVQEPAQSVEHCAVEQGRTIRRDERIELARRANRLLLRIRYCEQLERCFEAISQVELGRDRQRTA